MSRLVFSENAWYDYVYFQNADKKTFKRINTLLRSIERNCFDGIGRPQMVRDDLASIWCRVIDDKNKLVYRINASDIEILQCKVRYEDQ